MGAAQQDRFRERFEEAAKHIGASQNALAKASAALMEIYEAYKRHVKLAPVAAPFFAEHGENHGVRLAEMATRIITSQVDRQTPPALADIRALLFAYAGFLMHDIGMSIPRAGDTIEEMHRNQSVRSGHDDRSLIFIEESLIPFPEQFPSWQAFWADPEVAGELPSPQAEYAFLLLARVSKSHGDKSAIWLQDGSLETYRRQTGDQREIQFPDVWQHEWAAIRDIVYAAATFLSLCDPCDIGTERFVDVSREWDPLILPTGAGERAISAMHLLSHQVASVDPQADRLEARIKTYSENPWAYRMALYCGAVSDLLRWANAPIMVERVRTLINPAFQGARAIESVANNVAWRTIGERLGQPVFADCWPMRAINARLAGEPDMEPFPQHQAISMILMVLGRELSPRIENVEQYFFYRLIADLMRGGLLVDRLVRLEGSPASFAADLAVEETSASDGRITRFLGAIALVLILIEKAKNNRYRLLFAAHGSATFELLHGGGVDALSNVIFLVEVRQSQQGDAENYRRILENVGRRTEKNVHVIFVGFGLAKIHPELAASVETVHVRSDLALLQGLLGGEANEIRRDGESVIVKLGPGTAAPDLGPGEMSPGRLIREWWLRGAGLDGFISSIDIGLIDPDPEPYWSAASKLALITLVDVLATDGPLPLDQVAQEYERFRKRFGAEQLLGWEALKRSIPDEMFWSGRLYLPQGLIDATDFNPATRAGGTGWLMQLAATSVINSANIFSPQSQPVSGVPVGPRHTGIILDHLLGQGEPDVAKVRLGIAMSEFLGRQIVREGYGVSWFADLVPVQRLTMSVRDCLAFQMVYRVARHCMAEDAFDHDLALPKSTSALLGILEAACRQARSAGGIDTVLAGLISRLLMTITNVSGPAGNKAQIVAFDILTKYGGETPGLTAHANGFMVPHVANRWNELADMFHRKDRHEEPNEDKSLKQIPGYQQWAEFRKNFEFVLHNTDVELRRNARPDAAALDAISP